MTRACWNATHKLVNWNAGSKRPQNQAGRMSTSSFSKTAGSGSLYRRLPVDWWESASKKGSLANLPISRFMPNKNDADGLSVSRVGVSTIEIASTTAKGKRECLAEFPSVAATERGLTVVPKPTDRDPGHAVIAEMNYASMVADVETERTVQEHAAALAQASKLVWWPTKDDRLPEK